MVSSLYSMDKINTLEEARGMLHGIDRDNYYDRKLDKSRPATNIWSKSSLFKLRQDPAEFLEGPPFKETTAMALGKQIDSYLLEPERFRMEHEVAVKGPWNANPAKADVRRIRAMGKVPVKPEFMRAMNTIEKNLNAPLAAQACRQMMDGEKQVVVKGVVECSYVFDGSEKQSFIPITGLVDSIGHTQDGEEVMFDLKSTGAKNNYEMWKIGRDLGYPWQHFIYSKLREVEGHSPKDFKFVFVQKDSPHRVQVAKYDANAVAAAREDFYESLSILCTLGEGIALADLYPKETTFGTESNWESSSGLPEIIADVTHDWCFDFHAA